MITIHLPEALAAMHLHGWRLLCSDRERMHLVRGSDHCVLIANGDPSRTPRDMLRVVATRFAPVDVLDGALAAIDELGIARAARMGG